MWRAEGTPDTELLSGRDLRAGGSWLGLRSVLEESGSRTCRFSTILNLAAHTQPQRPDAPSRGLLPLRFLLGPLTTKPATFVESLLADATTDDMAGFVILCVDFSSPGGEVQASIARNFAREDGATPVFHLPAGIHELCNDGMLMSTWRRVRFGSSLFASILRTNQSSPSPQDGAKLAESLLEGLLLNQDLEDSRSSCVSSSSDMSVFIPADSSRNYGTRACTVIIGDKSGNVHVMERSFDEKAPPLGSEVAFVSIAKHGSTNWLRRDAQVVHSGCPIRARL